jgi:hypothetical protein
MNCKPGDLAVVLCPLHEMRFFGKIVQTIRFVNGDYWEVDPPLDNFKGVYDNWLRPIRDNDGEDEILRIAGKPEKANA